MRGRVFTVLAGFVWILSGVHRAGKLGTARIPSACGIHYQFVRVRPRSVENYYLLERLVAALPARVDGTNHPTTDTASRSAQALLCVQ